MKRAIWNKTEETKKRIKNKTEIQIAIEGK